jgi:hypothetical protein
MVFAFLLGGLSLGILVSNIVTIVSIFKGKTASTYFKVKASLIFNVVLCAIFVWQIEEGHNTYDIVSVLILLALIIWYASILKGRPANRW